MFVGWQVFAVGMSMVASAVAHGDQTSPLCPGRNVRECPGEERALMAAAEAKHWERVILENQCGNLSNATGSDAPSERGYYLGNRFLDFQRETSVVYFLTTVSGFEVPYTAHLANERAGEQLALLASSIGKNVCVTVFNNFHTWEVNARSEIRLQP